MDVGWFHRRWQQWKGEVRRWKQERAEEAWKKERLSALELTSILAQGSQAAARLSEAATVKSATELQADAEEYKDRMRWISPRVSGAQATAGLSKDASSQICPLVDDLIGLNILLCEASGQLVKCPEEALKNLRGLVHRAHRLTQAVRDVDVRMRSQLRWDREGAASDPATPAYKEFWDRLKFEHELLNQRITWLLTSQTILFAAYGFTLTKDSILAMNFQTVIAASGMTAAILMLIGILAGLHAKRAVWRDYQEDYNPRQKWGVRTGATWAGLVPDVCTPVVFVGAWMAVLISSP
jgi:hypothetical protein